MGDRPLQPPPQVVSRKDVPDGKNFRAPLPSTAVAAACAPGHKTAEGHQGRTDPEEIKRKKAEKQARKRLQAEREEINRRKRAREQGIVLPANPTVLPAAGGAPGAGAVSGGGEQQQREEKRQKIPKTEGEIKQGMFRNRLNICCKDNNFGTALNILQEMAAEEPPDLYRPVVLSGLTPCLKIPCASSPPSRPLHDPSMTPP